MCLIHAHVSVCVHVCVQVGICALWHVCPQHGAMAGPVPASWTLNLLRGSSAQWREVGWTHNDAPTICPGLPSDRDVLLGRPSRGTDSSAQPNPQDTGKEVEGGGGGLEIQRGEKGWDRMWRWWQF